MSDWTTQTESRRRNGAAADDDRERAEPEVEDWRWDWVDEPEPTAEPAPARPFVAESVPEEAATAAHEAARARHLDLTRRRRMVALAGLGTLFVMALVIPLVVFSGGGGKTAEQTTLSLTPAQPVTSSTRPATTATTTTTPTTTPQSSETTLRVVLPASGHLRRGDKGTAVEQLQRGLAALGFASGAPDGTFGATTEAAVTDFQSSNNLTPDGIVGKDTARLLNSALARKGAATGG
jgi:hypothetical protein